MLIRGNGAGSPNGSFARANGKRGLAIRGILLGSSALIGLGLTANTAAAQTGTMCTFVDGDPTDCNGGGGSGSTPAPTPAPAPSPSPSPTPAAFGGGTVTTTAGTITGGGANEGVLVEQYGAGAVTVTGVTITNTGSTPTVDGLRVVGPGGVGVGIDIATTSTITSQTGDGVRLEGGNGENIGFAVAAGQTLNVTGINGLHMTSTGGLFLPSTGTGGSIVATARTNGAGVGVLIATSGAFGGSLGNVTATNFATGISLSGNGVGLTIEGGTINATTRGITSNSTANTILDSRAAITSIDGIYATSANGTQVTTSGGGTINARQLAIGAGITAISTSGAGAVTVNSGAAIGGTLANYYGIDAQTTNSSTGAINITNTAAITGTNRGISAVSAGGAITVNANAAITATDGNTAAGIYASTSGAATVITTAAINSTGYGIRVNTGTGLSTVTVGSAITIAGTNGTGVEAYQVGAASVVNVNANITGGNRAVSGKGTTNVAAGVTVSSNVFGVDQTGGGTVNNSGAISANYRTVAFINGALNNLAGAAITSSGTYLAGGAGVVGTGTFTNAGSIAGNGGGDGVLSQGTTTLNNNAGGTVSGTRAVYHNSISTLTINNTAGTINGSQDGVIVQGGGRLSLTNTGTIQTAGGIGGGGASGIYLDSANGTAHSVTNSGTIVGGNYGVAIDTGALTLTNQSGGTITGGINALMLSTAGATSVTLNQGSTVTGAIFSEDSGTRTLLVNGALTGNYTGGTGTGVVAFTLGATGAMQSATFGGANDTFTFGGGTIGGSIAAGTGTDALISVLGTSGTGTLNQANLSGFETYEARSGTLTLTGTGNLGWSLTGGRLIVNGSILSAQGAIGAASGTQLDVGAGGSINTTANGGVAIQGPTGGTFRIDNAGAIGNGSSGGNTIQAGGTALTLNNSGTITTPNYVTVLGGANSIITNTGTITGGASAGGAGMGVQVNGVGTVNNNAGGLITTAGNYAIRFEGAAQLNNALGASIVYSGNANRLGAAVSMAAGGTIANLGTIDMPGTSGQGVILDNGGTVNNGSGSNTTALIRSNPGTGILSTGNAATNVINYGRITGGNGIAHVDGGSGALVISNLGATSVIDGVSYSGIVGESGGVTLQNQGVVAGMLGGVTSGGTTKISNSGMIGTGTVTGGVFTPGGTGHGVSLSGGTITNTGTISSTQAGIYATGAVTLSNTGTIRSAGVGGTSDGVVFNNAATMVTALNSGTIRSDIYSGFWSLGTLSLTNAAAGQLIGGTNANFGEGIQTNGVSTINNYGTITGSGTTTGIVQTGNFATTINLFAGSTTGSILTSSGNDTLALYSGQVNGAAVTQATSDAVSGAAGSVTLQNSGTLAAAVVGAIDLGGGTDTLQLRGTGTGAQAGSFAISTSTGAEVLTKADAGTWTLTGAAITPAITINAGLGGTPGSGGLLIFNGTTGLTGTINVNGGTVRANSAGAFGTGTINAIDPTIQYNANGTFANNISLASTDTVNDPTRLEVGQGFNATLTGQITQATAGQPLVFGLIPGATSGTFILNNPVLNNNWTGVTTIEAATTVRAAALSETLFQIAGSSIVNNGVLNFRQNNVGTTGQAISGSGSLLVDGTGAYVALFGTSTFTGGTTVDGATLQVGSGTVGSITGPIALANNALLVFSRSDNYVNSSAISGNGSVRLLGTETLNGNITSSGTVYADVSGGTATLGGTRSGATTASDGGYGSGFLLNGTNANLVVASTGTITGGSYIGVRVTGQGATASNFGSITNAGTGGNEQVGAGVAIYAVGGANTLTNGSVSNSTATISGQNNAINQRGSATAALTVNNYGTLVSTSYNAIEDSGSAGALTVNNTGSAATIVARGLAGQGRAISHGATSLLRVVNSGRMIGSTEGIFSAGAVNITNSGTIGSGTLSGTTTGTYTVGGSRGITTNSGGTITNQAGGQINGGNSAAIYSSAALTLGNAGNISTIAGGANDAVTILGVANVTNTGTITAADASGIAFTAAGTVINSGTITGGTNAAFGFGVAGGGSITNQTNGVLTGGAGGLNLTLAGTNTVNNSGQITGTNATSTGINARVGTLALTNNAAGIIAGRSNGIVSTVAGASITNAGTIGTGTVSGGAFTAAGTGVAISLAGGTLSNSGRVASVGDTAFTSTAGASVTNSGTVIGASGVTVSGGNATITNTGRIESTGTATGRNTINLSGNFLWTFTNDVGGVLVSPAGDVAAILTTGTVGGTIINRGSITSSYGVYVLSGSGAYDISNTGTITTDQQGIYSGSTGVNVVTNGGTITGGGEGIVLEGARTTRATITNTGVIQNGSYGVRVANGAVDLTNSGAIGGTTAAIAFSGNFADTLTLNAGSAITGSIALGDGDDALNFNGGTFSSTINGDGGTNSFNVALGAGNSNSINLGNVSNFAYYGLNSGNLTITGTRTGETGFNLANGTTLNVDGTFTGLTIGVKSRDTTVAATVNVLAGATLGGTGSDAIYLSGDTANSVSNAGTISSDTGFAVNLGGGSLTNSGTITGGTAGAVQIASDNAGTIDLRVNSVTSGNVLSFGTGDRTVTIAGMLSGDYLSSGTGVDTVTLSSTGSIANANLGDGDDVFNYFGGNVTGLVNGGNGMDSLFGDFGAGNAYNVTLSNFINFENFAFASGDATITGPSSNPDATIYAGNGSPSGQVTFVDTQDNTGEIYVNGGTIRAQTAGAFGSGTIHMVDPTIFYGASGNYANNILLEVTTPASNNPSTLSADSGVVATLNGSITQGSGTNINGDPIDTVQPLTIAGLGTIILAGNGNSWAGTTTINSGATLQGTTGTISGGDIALGGTLVYAQNTDGSVIQAITGNGALIKQGTGTVILSGQNGYNGGTSVQAGTLVAQNNGAGFGFGPVDIASGAVAQYDNQNPGPVFIAGGTTFTGAGTLRFTGDNNSIAIFGGFGNVTVSMAQGGLIDVQNGTLVGSSSDQGFFTGNQASLNVATGATLNGVEGDIIVDALTGGGSVLGGYYGRGSLTVGVAGGSGTFDGTLSENGTGAWGVTKNGAGTQTLTGTNSYTGQTTINGGTLALAGSGSIATSNVQNDAVFSIAGLTNGGTSILGLSGTGSVLLGANTLALNGGGASIYSGVAEGTGGITLQNGGTLSLSGANLYTGTTSIENGTLIFGASDVLADLSTLDILNGSTLDLNGFSDTVATLNLTGTLGNGGTLTATTYSVFGGSTINANLGTGTLNINGDTALNGESAASAVNIVAGTLALGSAERLSDAGAVSIASGGALTLGGTETIGSLADLGGTGGTVDLAGNLLTLGGANTSTSFSGAIGGAGGLTKTGTGTQILNGANTYTGLTTIDGGTLALGGGQAIDDNNAVLVNSGGTLALLANERVASLDGAGDVSLGTSTLLLGTNDASSTFSGVAGGTGGLYQTGTGTLTLSGANTYTGSTTIVSGTLVFGASNILADSSMLIVSNGMVNLGANNDTVDHFAMFGGTLNGTGTLTSTSTSGVEGYTVTDATIYANLGAGSLGVASGNTTTVLNGTAGAGQVNVYAGTLTLGASNRLADNAFVSAYSGTVLDLGANSDAVGQLNLLGTLNGTGTLTAATYLLNGGTANANLGAGTLVNQGGTSTLNGTSGAQMVFVSGGTLALGASDRLSNSAAVSVATGSTLNIGAFNDTVGNITIAGMLAGTGTITSSVVGGNGASYTLNGGTVNANLGTGILRVVQNASTLNGTAAADTVNITSGSLALGASNRLADIATVRVASGAALDLGAFNDTVGLLGLNGTLGGTGTLTASEYQLNGATVNANLGAGNLFNLSGGSILNGTSASALLNVQAGTLALGAANRLLDTATVVVANGATLDLNAFNDTVGMLSLAGTLNGTGMLTAAEYRLNGATVSGNLGGGMLLNTGGVSTLNGTAGATAVSVNAGTLRLGASNRLADTATVTVASGTTLDIAAFNDTVGLAGISGTLAGTGTLTASEIQLNGAAINANLGTGTLINVSGTSVLNGTSGATLVNVQGGTLTLGASERLANTAQLAINTGGTFSLLGYTEMVGSLTNGAAGGGTLALGTGRLVLAGNGDYGYSGQITGTGSVDHTGIGRLALMGDFAMTGRLDASAGTLAFAGTSLGSARVQGGALIGGGTFGGSLTMTSGTLSPGGLIGTNNAIQPLGMFRADSLAVSGGTLLFDFGGQNLGNLSDVIRVTGPAVLTGGTININALSATSQYAFNTEYTIVQAGTVNGTFANGTTFASVSNDASLKWRLRYDLVPNAVVLQVQKQLDFAAAVAGGSPNQLAIGNALNGSAGMASDQWAATLNAISAVPAAQRGATYNSLSGEALADISTSSIVANTLFMDLMRDRIGDGDDTLTGSGFASVNLSGVRSVSTRQRGLANALAARGDGSSGGAVWAQAYGSLQRLSGARGQATLETTAAGAAMGAEGRIGDLVVGVAGGYTGVTADVNARSSTVDGRLVQAGGYASYDSGAAFVNLAGNYYTGKFDSVRTINIGGTLTSALGDLKSHGYAVSASAGYRADLGGGLRMVAVASATQTHDTRDAFTERAPGGLGLNSAAAKRDLFTATGEVRLGQWIKTGSGYAMPYVSAGVRYNAGDLDTVGNMRFSGAPAGLGAFQVQGARISPLVGTWGAGVDVKASERVSLGIAIESAYAKHTREGRASMRVKIGF